MGEYAPGGVVVREYIWLGSRLIGMISANALGAVLQVHTDHLGTPRAVSQGDTVLWRWEGEAFGSTLPNETVAGSSRKLTMPLRFPGQYYDSETGLHYNYFRDYSPKIGRYVESDPIGLGGGINTYAYVDGSPLNGVDPKGLLKSCAYGVCTPDILPSLPISADPDWISQPQPAPLDSPSGPGITINYPPSKSSPPEITLPSCFPYCSDRLPASAGSAFQFPDCGNGRKRSSRRWIHSSPEDRCFHPYPIDQHLPDA